MLLTGTGKGKCKELLYELKDRTCDHTKQKKKGKKKVFFILCERYLLKGHGWKPVTEQTYEEGGGDWLDQTDLSMSSESLEE